MRALAGDLAAAAADPPYIEAFALLAAAAILGARRRVAYVAN